MSTPYSSTSTVDISSKIPTNIASAGLLSNTSDALTCFREQKLSSKLQAYMVSYVMSISGYYSVYK